ncbi:MAG: COX15/CtaA family protein [Pseudomonadota bacterium]
MSITNTASYNGSAAYAGDTVASQHRAVKIWFYTVAVLIAIMVLVGGATRLTDSGLSITEWAPVSGIIPPITHEQWLEEFAKYQTTDEFKYQNSTMTLLQFEFIFWWEWGHRFLGRLIGLAVLLPMIWFWVRGRMPEGFGIPSLVLFAGICVQGAIGWWMVKSGLVDRVDVSQIRLAVHLTLACIIFAYTVWLARSLGTHTSAGLPTQSWQGGALVVLVLSQTFLGGLVAGLDAGMAYNTWPTMNGDWMPQAVWAITPAWKNFVDNAVMVQFVHRTSAYFVLAAFILHAVWLMRIDADSLHARRAVLLVGLIVAQACVGIITLVLQVPISWALVHQFGGVVILAFATAHWRALALSSGTASARSAQITNTVRA